MRAVLLGTKPENPIEQAQDQEPKDGRDKGNTSHGQRHGNEALSIMGFRP